MSSGYTAHPSLNGQQLSGVSPEAFSVRERRSLVVTELATGNLRQTAKEDLTGLPDIKLKLSWEVNYKSLRGPTLRYVLAYLSRPGHHTFTDWRRSYAEWTVSGSQEFLLPWSPAPYVTPLPAEDPSGESFKPWISTSPDSDGFVVFEKSTPDYDSGSPVAGEAWVDMGGRRFKIGDALAPGSNLFASFVPLYLVYLRSDASHEYRNRGREERFLVIEEA